MEIGGSIRREYMDKRRQKRNARLDKTLDPIPEHNKTKASKMRIHRTLCRIRERLNYWMMVTEDRPMQWTPFHGIITEKSEDHFYTAREYYDTSDTTDSGMLIDLDDPNVKASNRIEVATWYQNLYERPFYCVMTIHSPIPCDEWGYLPLTRQQWNVLVMELIASHCLWQWVHAVREYTEDPTFNVAGVVGWHIKRSRKIKIDRNAEPCTSRVLYSHVIEKYLESEGVTLDTQCRL